MIFSLSQVDNFVSGPMPNQPDIWSHCQLPVLTMMTMESWSDGNSPLLASILYLQTAAAAWLCTVVSLTQCCSAAVCQTGTLLCIYNVLSRGKTIWVTRIHCSSIVQRMNKAMENLSFINFLFLCTTRPIQCHLCHWDSMWHRFPNFLKKKMSMMIIIDIFFFILDIFFIIII